MTLLVLGGVGFAAYHWFPVWYPLLVPAQAGPVQVNRAVLVASATARKGDLRRYINALGTVTAFNTVVVRARVDGQLIKVAYKEGQAVKSGDPLCTIDPRPFQVALTQAEGQRDRDQAALDNAKRDLKRYIEAGDAASEMQRSTALSSVDQFKAALETDDGVIANSRLNLVYCDIRSPIDGVIGLRLVDEGNMVHASDATGLVVVTQLEPISVLFPVAQDHLPDLRKASEGGKVLDVQAYDRPRKNRLAIGELSAWSNQIDPGTGTLQLKALFANKDHALFPNQFVNIRLLVETRKDAVLIPAAGIQRSPTDTFVYVVKPDKDKPDKKVVEKRTIKTGLIEGETASIDEGLAVGETVVIDNVDKLQPGSEVSPTTQPDRPGSRGGKPAAAATQSAGETGSWPAATRPQDSSESSSPGRGAK
jgi:multidrug efflux system membrane fusion protein